MNRRPPRPDRILRPRESRELLYDQKLLYDQEQDQPEQQGQPDPPADRRLYYHDQYPDLSSHHCPRNHMYRTPDDSPLNPNHYNYPTRNPHQTCPEKIPPPYLVPTPNFGTLLCLGCGCLIYDPDYVNVTHPHTHTH